MQGQRMYIFSIKIGPSKVGHMRSISILFRHSLSVVSATAFQQDSHQNVPCLSFLHSEPYESVMALSFQLRVKCYWPSPALTVPDSEEAMAIIFYHTILQHDVINMTMLCTYSTYYLAVTLSHSQLHPIFLVQMRYFLKHFTSNTILCISVFHLSNRVRKDTRNFTHGNVWKRKCISVLVSPFIHKWALCWKSCIYI
jgi:hypothetical protein